MIATHYEALAAVLSRYLAEAFSENYNSVINQTR